MEQSGKNRAELFQRLAKQSVWIPCRKEENGNITLELLMNGERQQYIPAFFSPNSGTGNFKPEDLVSLPFSLLRHTLIELPERICGIVIEPFGDNLSLSRKMLQDFDIQVSGMSVSGKRHRGRLILSVPETLPYGLKESLQSFCSEQICIDEAWILLAREEGEAFPHWLFVVDLSGRKIEVFPEIAKKIRPFMKNGERFELMERNGLFRRDCFTDAQIYKSEIR